jgi:AcrR family transcriptional regulator
MPAMAVESSVRGTPKGARTRQRILDTAEELFAEKGYTGTTLRDVATASGLRIPSLYNHFVSKESLYAAVLERGIAPLFDALSDYVEGGPKQQDREAFVAIMFRILGERPNLPRLVQREVMDRGELVSPILRDQIKPILAKAEEVIRALPGARRWEPDQIPLLLLALYHLAVGAFSIAPLYKALDREDLLTPDATARHARFFGDVVSALLPEEDQETPNEC